MSRHASWVLWALLSGVPSLSAQQYRARVDASAQSVSYKGLVMDSIAAADVLRATDGRESTPDGFAVRCGAGDYCFYLRPGPALHAMPASSTASVTLWGLGVDGLTARVTARVVADLGQDGVWPATEPVGQLLEGYVDYQRAALTARAGRLLVMSRLEPIGFDGAWLRTGWRSSGVTLGAYGGWGLGRAATLPVSSPALNPLDEWRPDDRQLVAAADAAWSRPNADVSAEYRREIDPQDRSVVSERAGLSLSARAASILARGGADFNIAEGRVGSADLMLTYMQPQYSLSLGARRYRPYFSLWTLWGAFSPVSYHALNASAQARTGSRLTLHARGEAFRYDDAAVSVAIVPDLEDRGWRGSIGADVLLGGAWTGQANLGMERGPGAASRFADASVAWTRERFTLDVYGGRLERPLELRFYDATSAWAGTRAEWRVSQWRRVWTEIALIHDDRDRPDASAWSMTQTRVRAGVSAAFGTNTDRTLPPALPPARRPTR